MEVSDRIVIFSKGNLEQIGTPREVYEQPANEFVARFIGVMNVLEVTVQNGIGADEISRHFIHRLQMGNCIEGRVPNVLAKRIQAAAAID